MGRAPGELPLWARAADALVGTLLLAALFVVATGGAVFRLGGLLVSVTSAWRPLAWAAVVLFVRHLIIRQVPFPLSIVRSIRSGARAAGPLREDDALFALHDEARRWGKASRDMALATIVYAAAAWVMTYPQARLLTETVLPEYGDPLLSTWRLHRRLRDGILVGTFLVLQTLSSLYYGVFFATDLVVAAALIMLGAGRERARGALRPLAGGAILAAVMIAPFTIPYLRARDAVGERRFEEIEVYSATPGNYLAAPYHNVMFGPASWREERGGAERDLFPGFAAPLVAVVGMWPPLSAARIAYVFGLAFAFEASLGVNGYVYPFLHRYVFPYRGLRVPARMAILVGLSLAILVGFGAARIAALCRRRWLAAVALSALAAGVLVEYRTTVNLRPIWRSTPPVYSALPPSTRVVFEMPLVEPDTVLEPIYMYFSTFHWHKLVNGYSGFSPRSHQQLVEMMPSFPDDAGMAELRRREVDAIIVHGAFHREQEVYRSLVNALDKRPDVALVRTMTWEGYESRVYLVLK